MPSDALRERGYKKIDLHIHTPCSFCYHDHMMPEPKAETSPQEIIDAALAANLDAIAITDHNTAEGIEALRDEANKNGLCLFPGLEITTRGGHVLALFEPDIPVERLRLFLRDLGFKPEEEGEGYYQTGLFMDEVFRRIEEIGGVAIAAHVDRRPRGFIVSDESLEDRRRIHESAYLSALEITVPQDKARWNQGLMSHYPRRRACIQGSDAHAPSEIARRPTYIGVPDVTLEGLRLAFREFAERIRFPEEL